MRAHPAWRESGAIKGRGQSLGNKRGTHRQNVAEAFLRNKRIVASNDMCEAMPRNASAGGDIVGVLGVAASAEPIELARVEPQRATAAAEVHHFALEARAVHDAGA